MAVLPSPDAELVIQFANTRDLRTFAPPGGGPRSGEVDTIATPEGLEHWLADQALLPDGVVADRSDVTRLAGFRRVLRAALQRQDDLEPAPAAEVVRVPLNVVLTATDEPRLVPEGTGTDAVVGEIFAAAARTAFTGEWWRIRVCAAPDCRWVYYDGSKPGRGRYCAPDSCGNRVKSREYRRRKAAHHG